MTEQLYVRCPKCHGTGQGKEVGLCCDMCGDGEGWADGFLPYAQPRPMGVPDGWKLVPTDPDQAMRRAGAVEVIAWGSTLDPCSVYRAMLAAAPVAGGG